MPYRIDLAPAPDDAAVGRLIDLGAVDIERTAGGLAALMPDAADVDAISHAAGGATVQVTPAAARDDGSIWILTPGPVIAGGITIVPPGADAAAGALRLHDSAAFGTGRHPTTALCLEAIRDAVTDGRPARVLDVGTGSGVLALAALKMGVPRACGLDVDAVAIGAAAGNARVNGLTSRIDLVRGDVRCLRGAWPLVVANILAAPLIEMASDLAPRVAHAGQLALSGIPAGLASEVERAYVRAGMRRTGSHVRDGWALLALQPTW